MMADLLTVTGGRASGRAMREKSGRVSAPVALVVGLIIMFLVYLGVSKFVLPNIHAPVLSASIAVIGGLMWRYTPLKTFGLIILGVGIIGFLIYLGGLWV